MKTKATAIELTADWKTKALSAVLEFANEHVGESFVGEDIRAFAEANGVPIASDGRYWGHLLKEAERKGAIEKVGFAPTRSSNGSPKVLWKMLGA
jgi:hypothetical protein